MLAAGSGEKKSCGVDYVGRRPVEVAGMGWPGELCRKVAGGSCRNGLARGDDDRTAQEN